MVATERAMTYFSHLTEQILLLITEAVHSPLEQPTCRPSILCCFICHKNRSVGWMGVMRWDTEVIFMCGVWCRIAWHNGSGKRNRAQAKGQPSRNQIGKSESICHTSSTWQNLLRIVKYFGTSPYRSWELLLDIHISFTLHYTDVTCGYINTVGVTVPAGMSRLAFSHNSCLFDQRPDSPAHRRPGPDPTSSRC